MRVDQKLIALGITVASVVSLLTISGCNNRQSDSATQAANTTAGMEIDDTVVTARVKSALLADPEIRSFDLKVETRKGTVQLSGFVDNQAQVDRAVKTTHEVDGVRSVDNSISLKEGHATLGNTVDDDVITAKVKSALLADPDIKSLDISVVTRKGDVQLSGFVNGQAQIDQALAIATKVSGVTSIRNQMSIKQ
jgi:hyperosmotically inducible protein